MNYIHNYIISYTTKYIHTVKERLFYAKSTNKNE